MKKILFVLLACMFSTAMFAQKVSKEQALQKAQKFFKDKGIVSANPRRAKKVEQQSDATQEDFYVFNVENNGGFVIISGDDRTPDVLGYADSGNIEMDNLPPNLKGWLEGYSKQIKAINNSNIARSRAFSKSVTRAPKTAIAPLLTTKWGQDDPYNMNCPDFFNTGDKCVTGCVATALAQVMKYHNYPIKGNGEHQYSFQPSSGDGRIIEANFGETTYEWDKMLDNYKSSYTDEEALAVATLMLHCCVAVDMDYTPSGSGAYGVEACQALKKYFSYNKNTRLYTRNFYSAEAWMQMIYKELNQYGPIYYSGVNPSSGGHAFVLEGYDETGLVRINWGWGGSSNGLFDIALLNPSGSQYSAEQQMILKLDPSVETPYESQIVAETLTFTILSTKKSVTITGRVYNAGAEKFTGKLSCVLENIEDRSITTLRTSDEMAMEPITNGQYWIKNFSLPANSLSSVANGTYRLYVGSSTADDTSWQLVRPKEGEINSYLITKTDEGVTWEECRTDLWSIGVPTSIHPVVKSMPNTNAPLRFYDLQGREVNAGTKGLVIRKQGNDVKKVVVR
jgi:hypothetical protein